MKLVLATKNLKKRDEMQEILGAIGVETVLQSELGVDIDVEETGATFEENAALKAKAVMGATGLAAVADDSGLVVDALGGKPGIYSARYGGDACQSDIDRYNLLLKNMENVPDEKRTARFVSVIACRMPDGETILARGECEGVIARGPSGEGGFGYDPVFFIAERQMTMAEISQEEKNRISHRAKALAQFREKLEERERCNADK